MKYINIPNDLLQDKRVRPTAKLLYGVIATFIGKDGYCWAGDVILAQQIGTNSHHLYRLLNELVKNGWIKRETGAFNPQNGGKERKIWLNKPSPKMGENIPPEMVEPTPQMGVNLPPSLPPKWEQTDPPNGGISNTREYYKASNTSNAGNENKIDDEFEILNELSEPNIKQQLDELATKPYSQMTEAEKDLWHQSGR